MSTMSGVRELACTLNILPALLHLVPRTQIIKVRISGWSRESTKILQLRLKVEKARPKLEAFVLYTMWEPHIRGCGTGRRKGLQDAQLVVASWDKARREVEKPQ
jgi:hypothetical protein